MPSRYWWLNETREEWKYCIAGFNKWQRNKTLVILNLARILKCETKILHIITLCAKLLALACALQQTDGILATAASEMAHMKQEMK